VLACEEGHCIVAKHAVSSKLQWLSSLVLLESFRWGLPLQQRVVRVTPSSFFSLLSFSSFFFFIFLLFLHLDFHARSIKNIKESFHGQPFLVSLASFQRGLHTQWCVVEGVAPTTYFFLKFDFYLFNCYF